MKKLKYATSGNYVYDLNVSAEPLNDDEDLTVPGQSTSIKEFIRKYGNPGNVPHEYHSSVYYDGDDSHIDRFPTTPPDYSDADDALARVRTRASSVAPLASKEEVKKEEAQRDDAQSPDTTSV